MPSPAGACAELHNGDVILAVNGKNVRRNFKLFAEMMGQRLRHNRPVTLTLNTKDREAKAGEGGRGAAADDAAASPDPGAGGSNPSPNPGGGNQAFLMRDPRS